MNIKERDYYRCRACGYGQNLHVHHIIYRSHGGPDEPWNLITLCKRCHDTAHGLNSKEFYAKNELHGLIREDCFSIKTYRYKFGSSDES